MLELSPWKVLVVDDDDGIHSITRMVFRGYTFEGRPIELLNALSAVEARTLLAQHPDIAVAILDVVMETDQAGLELVTHIRQNTANRDIRIILRTGHPGFAPEADVIIEYDINDYLSKAELSASRLLTSVVVALRSYRDLQQKSGAPTAISSPLAASHDAQPLSLSGTQMLSAKLEQQLQPLKRDLHQLQQLSHKPMAQALLAQLEANLDDLALAATVFSPLDTAHSTHLSCAEILERTSACYLTRALQQGWIFDYTVNDDALEQLRYPAQLLQLVCSCIELLLSWANPSQISLEVEGREDKVSFTFSTATTTGDGPWSQLLQANAASLAEALGAGLEVQQGKGVLTLQL
ncbi:MAG: response regulator [Pseudomonadales bacterium]